MLDDYLIFVTENNSKFAKFSKKQNGYKVEHFRKVYFDVQGLKLFFPLKCFELA